MVIWTPEEWEKELNEFATAVREKKFNKIPYDKWKKLWSWRDLSNTTVIYLKICAGTTNRIMISPKGEPDFITFIDSEKNWSFIEYLQSKYSTIFGFAESSTQYPITIFTQPHSMTDMTYTNYTEPIQYNAASNNTVLNTNLLTSQGFKQEYDTFWQATTTTDNKRRKRI